MHKSMNAQGSTRFGSLMAAVFAALVTLPEVRSQTPHEVLLQQAEPGMPMTNQEHRKKPAGFVSLWAALTMPCVALGAAGLTSEALSTNRPESAGGATNATLQAALQKLKFPGVAINVQERCVDVESSVCLHRGALELVACTKEPRSMSPSSRW